MIFTCRHKVIKTTCGPKLPQNVFSSPNRPEKVLNGIPQMSGTPWIKGHLGLEKSMVTKYGVWDTWDDFSFLTPKKKTFYVQVRTCTYRYVQTTTRYVPVRTGMYRYVQVCTGTYRYVPVRKTYHPVRTSTYRYVPVRTNYPMVVETTPWW